VATGDCEHLVGLARDKTVAGRHALVATVADLFFARKNVLSDRERMLMTDILRQLIHDVEVEVRRALAVRLAGERKAPAELVSALANDSIEVAHAILLHSDVLQDEELVEIIHHRTLEHQLAIAMRREVSETVSDALVSRGNPDVVKTLLENPQAQISRTALEYLVEESRRVDTYQNPLLRRPELGPDLAKRMYWWVSAALRKFIVENFAVDPATIDDELEGAVTTLAEAPAETQPRKAQLLAERLAQLGEISSATLVETLRHGEVALFEAMFARLAGLRLTLVRRLLFEPGGEGLAIACKALGIDTASFASIFVLSRKARHERAIEPGEATRVIGFYHRLNLQSATQLLKKWQRERDYLKAVWEVGRGERQYAAV
jgi:uncharacterized protein (DUF2336 family)